MNKTFSLLLSLLLLSSCATIFSDSSDKITFNSDPAGAEVYINGVVKGKTPLEVTMERDTFKKYTVQFKKVGFEAQESQITKTLNTTALFNIAWLCFSETSAGIDALTGAIIRYSPTAYMAILKKQGSGASFDIRSQKTLYVFVNAHHLRRDLAQGGGVYLEALLELYALPKTQLALARDRIVGARQNLVKIEKAVDLNWALDALLKAPALSLSKLY